MSKAKKPEPIDQYAACMREIKHRFEVIDHFVVKQESLLYRQTSIETVCLQMRKILELIAFASLCTNKDAYSAVHDDFAKHYHANFLLNALEKINPDFYPRPIIEQASKLNSTLEYVPRQNDYLTRVEFEKAYEKCGSMLHAHNPFRQSTPYEYFEKAIPKWRMEIINLLNMHSVRLLDEESSFWLIQMHVLGSNEVHYTKFMPITSS
jgi:hypothetical protein